MTIAGQFKFANTPIAGGTISTGQNGNYNGGAGAGAGGGGGGEGPGGGTQACVSASFTGSGGGGGGNYSIGGHGLKNYVPADAGTPALPTYPGGLVAGAPRTQGNFRAAAAAARSGGGNANGEYWGGAAGGNGGGAVVFSTRGTIHRSRFGCHRWQRTPGATNDGSGNPGNSGGGAGGDQWFFAKSFTNAGQISLHTWRRWRRIRTSRIPACSTQKKVNGPEWRRRISGGVLMIFAPTIANSGTINLSGGNGTSAPNGGLLQCERRRDQQHGNDRGRQTTE